MPSDVMKMNRIFGEKCSERNNMLDNAVVPPGSVVPSNTIDCIFRIRKNVNLFATRVFITPDSFQRAANSPNFSYLVGTLTAVVRMM